MIVKSNENFMIMLNYRYLRYGIFYNFFLNLNIFIIKIIKNEFNYLPYNTFKSFIKK